VVPILAVVVPRIPAGEGGGDGLAVGITLALLLLSFALCRAASSLHAELDRISRRIFEPPRARMRPAADPAGPILLKDAPTAVLFVEGYDLLGIESLIAIGKLFRGAFSQILFLAVRAFDAGDVQERGAEARRLKEFVEKALEKYGPIAELLDLAADRRVRLGNEPVDEGVGLAEEIRREFPRSVFFFPRLVPEPPQWYYRFLESPLAREGPERLKRRGIVMMELRFPLIVGGLRAVPKPFRAIG